MSFDFFNGDLAVLDFVCFDYSFMSDNACLFLYIKIISDALNMVNWSLSSRR